MESQQQQQHQHPHETSSSSSSSSTLNSMNGCLSEAYEVSEDATKVHTDEEEEARLQYILNQLNEKQVPPKSHHGLTILITGANR